MAQAGFTPIVIYHSTTGAAVPTAGNLVPGELGLNIADMKLYCENSAGVVTLLASSSGASGDVVGPASSTDNAIVRFDGTTGKLVQNSGVTIDDSGNMVVSVNSATDALRITQTGAGNALVVEDSANPDSSPFVVDASGRIIAGYTSAVTTAPGINPLIQTNGVGTGILGSIGMARWDANANSQFLQFTKSRSGTIGTFGGVVSSGDLVGTIQWSADDGTSPINLAQISAVVDGTPGVGDMPGRLVFSTTADGASSPTERMRIDSAGRVGFGASNLAATTIRVGTNITGAVTSFGIFNASQVQSDVTTSARAYSTSIGTANDTFTLSALDHYRATQGTFGALSTVTNQYGFSADSSLTGATNNYGFYSNIASGTGRFNFYANGTADNFFGGDVIVSVNTTDPALRITQVGTGNALVVEDSSNPDATPFQINSGGAVTIGHTSNPFITGVGTNFALVGTDNLTSAAGISRFSNDADRPRFITFKSRGAIGAQGLVSSGDSLGAYLFVGSDGTNFIQGAAIEGLVDGTPGTNDMPGRLVFSTTADGASSPTERMRIDSAGNVGIGGTTVAGFKIANYGNLSGAATAYSYYAGSVYQSDVTTNGIGFGTFLGTVNASFTLASLSHHRAAQGTIGASSTVTNQFGFEATSGLTGATNNFGFFSDIASGTGRWNFYANGTAENYLGGNLKIGAITARGTTAGTNHLSIFNGTAPAGTLTNGITLYSASGDFNFMDAAGNAFKVGYRNIPPVGTKNSSYTLQTADVGEYVQVTTGGSITIPDATFAEGDVVSIFNNTTGTITITCSITTAYIAGTDSDKATMTLATRGVATVLFISGTVCVVSGNVT